MQHRAAVMSSLFKKDIKYLKGVGSRRAELFNKLGVSTVGALIRFYPRSYNDFSQPIPISQAPLDKPCCIKARVISPVTENLIRKGMTIYKTLISDDQSIVNLTFFNNKFIKDMLKTNEEYVFLGILQNNYSKLQMNSPLFEKSKSISTMKPIYAQTYGLSSNQISSAVKQALSLLPDTITDPIPSNIREKYDLCDLKFALNNIHFPENNQSLKKAKKRLIFEELLLLQLGISTSKTVLTQNQHTALEKNFTDDFLKLLPFDVTNAQMVSIQECMNDMMNGNRPMSRLIQGDVGSGKTVIAGALCFNTIKNNMQAALMVPTEILAKQHFIWLSFILSGLNIKIELLTGSTAASRKKRTIEKLKQGEIDLIVGTHALISDGVEFKNLGLVVTDEQHRFGVKQRSKLFLKGKAPHMLVMSATPIPRTLALIIYGDLDISIVDELPPGRQKIDTFFIDSSKRIRSFNFLKDIIQKGGQGYIVCPLVESSETNLISAEGYAEQLQNGPFKDYKVGLLHGKMKSKDKNLVIENFSKGNIDLLVSTTVIEVGVNVPSAIFMVIENAERFGLSQLHQLRGRVGRGSEKSYCILISDAQNQDTIDRLEIMTTTNSGFKIAEEDLKLRGPGDFFGDRQHGLPELKLAKLLEDSVILKNTQDAAKKILEIDPQLNLDQHRMLKAEIKMLFNNMGQSLN